MNGITGIAEIDKEILLRLDDKDLFTLCRVNKYFRSLCQEDMFFWKRRIKERFDPIMARDLLHRDGSLKQIYIDAIRRPTVFIMDINIKNEINDRLVNRRTYSRIAIEKIGERYLKHGDYIVLQSSYKHKLFLYVVENKQAYVEPIGFKVKSQENEIYVELIGNKIDPTHDIQIRKLITLLHPTFPVNSSIDIKMFFFGIRIHVHFKI